MIQRVYVEKKAPYAGEAAGVLARLREVAGPALTGLRLFNRYDAEGVSPDVFARCRYTIFAEPQLDDAWDALPDADALLAVEYLPGQYDQRADSCEQCIQVVTGGERPTVRTARVYALYGKLGPDALAAIRKDLINPVESREASLALPAALKEDYPAPGDSEPLPDFLTADDAGLARLRDTLGLAMDTDDMGLCQDYFRGEGRAPTLTEIRVIDTYWSDHCRHTTFNTRLDKVDIEDELVQAAFARYMALREEVYPGQSRPVTLMDMGTIGGKVLRARGVLTNQDISDEINACSIKIKVETEQGDEDWLLMFKNETHNHPTEIEPFGGAATCIGGAIRDPLSGRSYVYQAMRVSGGGDPRTPLEQTLPGKLPQKKLVTTATAGYSSYGNQIGLATGLVQEVYHPGYVAKHMEVGAVLGAAPARQIVRETPAPGDVVVLLGGRTGRDGMGGATGSSKSHTEASLTLCGAEVQKGNAPEERKLQRLFRNPDATRLIKRCNDFGAGGVSVAIGELADGLVINLDAVPKKYDGLDGTELAISESQERMAVVLAPESVDAFIALADRENLEATPVAVVTKEPRLVMNWRGRSIVNIPRAFLDTNGAEKHARAHISAPAAPAGAPEWKGLGHALKAVVQDINVAGQRGLTERFDASIGGGTVLMPLGGKYQLTPVQAMVAKLPVEKGTTNTVSAMAFGMDPYLLEADPYAGAYCAVAESVAKLVAAGFSRRGTVLSFQEYFPHLGTDQARWGLPVQALLGALDAQIALGTAAIGGKDSMSGTFEHLHVPPTLISFAVNVGRLERVVTGVMKNPGATVVLLAPAMAGRIPDGASLAAVLDAGEALLAGKQAVSAWAVSRGGVAEGLFKMLIGNGYGFRLAPEARKYLTGKAYGALVLELAPGAPVPAGAVVLGQVTGEPVFAGAGEEIPMADLLALYENVLEPVYPYHSQKEADAKAPVEKFLYTGGVKAAGPKVGMARPHALITVFPGTNSEYDTARSMERAGIEPEILVVRNLTPAAVSESVAAMAAAIDRSQILFIPGGFSAGDEPDGSGKFMAAFFRSPAVLESVRRLLGQRDGLAGGICNGFQALIKMGLVPFGDIVDTNPDCPTLTNNAIGRHQSRLVRTRIASNLSPWYSRMQVDEVYTLALSHGEGRFVAPAREIARLAAAGQIATQYVDLDGRPTMDLAHNPNGAMQAIESITSPDGRVMGKMAHHERYTRGIYRNVDGLKDMPLFEGAADYFKV